MHASLAGVTPMRVCSFVRYCLQDLPKYTVCAAVVGEQRQKKAEKMMDDGEGAGGHGYS